MTFITSTKESSFDSFQESHTTIKDYLKSRSFTIVSSEIDNPKYQNNPLLSFAQRLAILDKDGYVFLKYLRNAICQKNSKCCFDLRKLSPSQQKSSIEIANMLCSIGALRNARISNAKLVGNFTFSSTNFITFSSGCYLELAAYKLLYDFAIENRLDCEIAPNLIISSSNTKYELDMFLRINNSFFVIEAKCGHFDNFDHYRARCKELGINEKQFIFIFQNRSNEELQLMQHFQDFTITSYSSLKDCIKKIINI